MIFKNRELSVIKLVNHLKNRTNIYTRIVREKEDLVTLILSENNKKLNCKVIKDMTLSEFECFKTMMEGRLVFLEKRNLID